jgi:pimeloyl-ACP methyl ester carboxylesterase
VGFICKDNFIAAYGNNCFWLPNELLQRASYEPARIWQEWTIGLVRGYITFAWLLLVWCASICIAASVRRFNTGEETRSVPRYRSEPSKASFQVPTNTHQPSQQRTIVILIHSIRTAAWWQKRVAATITDELGATVIPLNGYLDLFRFLCPFGFCRHGPIEKLRKQLQGIRDDYRDSRLIVFAHSYGTYALSQILLKNPRFTFDRVILCGSIIPDDFDWDRVQNQILSKDRDKRDAIINECGLRDPWPVFASSVSWGYGATGTFGFQQACQCRLPRSPRRNPNKNRNG